MSPARNALVVTRAFAFGRKAGLERVGMVVWVWVEGLR
jgi:hypothetical protein